MMNCDLSILRRSSILSSRCRGAWALLSVLLLLGSRATIAQEDAKQLYKASISDQFPAGAQLLSGNWVAHNGTASQGDASKEGLALLYEPAWSQPYTAKVMVRVTRPQFASAAGLAVQVSNSNNFVAFSLEVRKSGPYAVLKFRVDPRDGTITQEPSLVGDEAPVAVDLGTWHDLSVDVFGPHMFAYLDGKPVAGFSFLGVSAPAHTHDGILWPQDPSHGKVGLYTDHSTAEFKDFSISQKKQYDNIVTPQLPLRDAEGALLPRQSYAETMRQLTEWLINSPSVVDESIAPLPLRKLPPYLLTNWVDSDDMANLRDNINEFAFNHSMLISGAVRYYVFSGDQRALKLAQQVADWHLANRTPADWALPYLPPSTVNWQPDGSWKGQEWGLEPDKSAYMGMALLKLYAATGEERYKSAVLQIATTLRRLQKPDGSWPFRVDPKSGDIKFGYTENALFYVEFYEQVGKLTGNADYQQAATRSLQWLLDNPVKTNDWRSLYGDIKTGKQSYDQWIPLETAMYLLDHREGHAEYLGDVKSILDWVNRTLVMNPGLEPGVPGLMEQTVYRVVLTHHQLRLAELYGKLWNATGDTHDRDLAVQIANSVTWCLMSDGKMRLGLGQNGPRIPMVLIYDDQFADIMTLIPETAPKGETHLLKYSSDVRKIEYRPEEVTYSTVAPGEEWLVVRAQPVQVTLDGTRMSHPDQAQGEGWTYDAATGMVHVRHAVGKIQIRLQ